MGNTKRWDPPCDVRAGSTQDLPGRLAETLFLYAVSHGVGASDRFFPESHEGCWRSEAFRFHARRRVDLPHFHKGFEDVCPQIMTRPKIRVHLTFISCPSQCARPKTSDASASGAVPQKHIILPPPTPNSSLIGGYPRPRCLVQGLAADGSHIVVGRSP